MQLAAVVMEPADPLAKWLGADDLDHLVHFALPTPPPPPTTADRDAALGPAPTATSALAEASFLRLLGDPGVPSSPPRRRKPPQKQQQPQQPRDNALTDAEEARREKNRQKVRRHYYRKLHQLHTLRTEVAELESQFQSLVAIKQSETSWPMTTTTAAADGAAPPSTAHGRLRVELEALEQENHHLRQVFAERHEHYAQLRALFLAERELFRSGPLARLLIKPFTRDECYRVRDKAVEEVLALSSKTAPGSAFSQRGPGIAGWQDEVTVDNNVFTFSLAKVFRHADADALVRISWPLLTDPTTLARLYSAAVECKCVVVQEVDDDNVVMFQEYRTMDQNNEYRLMKSLFLVTRAAVDDGFLLIIRGLGEDRLHDRELCLPSGGEFGGQIVWHDIFSWVKLERTGLYGEDTKCIFSGIAPTVGSNVQFWSFEVLMLVLRWECKIRGPPQLLKSDDDDGSHAHATPGGRTPPLEIVL